MKKTIALLLALLMLLSCVGGVAEEQKTFTLPQTQIPSVTITSNISIDQEAVMNLLPLPALDGGKIFFLVINTVAMLLFKKQIPAKYENYIHYGGLILLLGLMLVITFHDVWKLFT